MNRFLKTRGGPNSNTDPEEAPTSACEPIAQQERQEPRPGFGLAVEGHGALEIQEVDRGAEDLRLTDPEPQAGGVRGGHGPQGIVGRPA